MPTTPTADDQARGGHSAWGYHQGCRCTAARAARREREMPDTVAHGENSTYVNWSCRCPACTEAHRLAWRPRPDPDEEWALDRAQDRYEATHLGWREDQP